MRPRHHCRGRGGLLRGPGRGRRASMRPRHHCRGRGTSASRSSDGTAGFNEAPASLPGKRSDGILAVVHTIAASMRPRHHCRGRGGAALRRGAREVPASMRPRHHCRGRGRARRTRCCRGPCFNEAPASLPGKSSRGQATVRVPQTASMRPRHHCRGRAARRRAPAGGASRASMRPRHHCRGREHGHLGRGRQRPCFNEAPASLPGKRQQAAPPQRAAERFNEAPASLPGKSRHHLWPAAQPAVASMRPRHHCRGRGRCWKSPAPRWRRFNEAPASLPGKRTITAWADDWRAATLQ